MNIEYKIHMTPHASAVEVTKLIRSNEVKFWSEKHFEYLQIIMNEKELPYALAAIPRSELDFYNKMSFFASEGQPAEYAQKLGVQVKPNEVLMHLTSGVSLKFALIGPWRERVIPITSKRAIQC